MRKSTRIIRDAAERRTLTAVFLAIWIAHHVGRETAKPFRQIDLAKSLDVSHDWVKQAIEVAERRDLIEVHRSERVKGGRWIWRYRSTDQGMKLIESPDG